ncbi:acyl carrier protein [Microbulbifer sp. 2201CG32-9]|uniref:acyl carrier protein n=1 Tax=unclassified Microbulbifer TaxID=2619833 RepID=UPI00345B68DF
MQIKVIEQLNLNKARHNKMQREEVYELIKSSFNEKEAMKGISDDENFFSRGVSSLTVVELQIAIEKSLNVTVQTSDLMRAPTIGEWVELYASQNG